MLSLVYLVTHNYLEVGMARGINKVILVGNLGGDPEVRYMPNGNAVTNINIATTDSWTDKQTGQRQDRTEWHRVVFFNRLAEIAGEYLRKGSQVYVEGALRTRKWQDQKGIDRYTTEVVGSEMQMLGGRASEGGYQQTEQPPMQQSYNQGAQQQSAPPPQMQQPQTAPAPAPQAQVDDFDDDIPF